MKPVEAHHPHALQTPLADRTTRLGVRVRPAETDLLRVVHHTHYLAYCEVGRLAWLERRGVSVPEWLDRGMYLTVLEANICYRAPARLGDRLLVTTVLDTLGSASLAFDAEITRGEVLVAEAYSQLALVGPDGRLVRFDDVTRALLLAPEQANVSPEAPTES